MGHFSCARIIKFNKEELRGVIGAWKEHRKSKGQVFKKKWRRGVAELGGSLSSVHALSSAAPFGYRFYLEGSLPKKRRKSLRWGDLEDSGEGFTAGLFGRLASEQHPTSQPREEPEGPEPRHLAVK